MVINEMIRLLSNLGKASMDDSDLVTCKWIFFEGKVRGQREKVDSVPLLQWVSEWEKERERGIKIDR